MITILSRLTTLHRALDRLEATLHQVKDLPQMSETRLLVKLADLQRELETLVTLTANLVEDEPKIVNAIQYDKLKIVARLGELMPASPPAERGQGRGKVAANKAKIDAYYERAKGNGEPAEEITLGGFMRFATGTEKMGGSAASDDATESR